MMSCRWVSGRISWEMVAISWGVTLFQQESLYDYLLNPLVVSMAHCFPVKKRGGLGFLRLGAYRVIFGVEGHSAAN